MWVTWARWPGRLFSVLTSQGGGVIVAGLQTAYDDGQTIAPTVLLGPVGVTNVGNAEALAFLLHLQAAAGAVALAITQTADADAVQVEMQTLASSKAALQIAADTINQAMVSLLGVDGYSTVLRGSGLAFGLGADDNTRVVVRTGDSSGNAPPLVLCGGMGVTGTFAGRVELGFADTAEGATTDGGFVLEQATGRMQLRRHALGAAGVDQTGALQLHVLTGAQAALLGTLQDGDVFLRSDDGAGPARESGLNAYRASALGLVARVYQRTFEDADLAGSDLAVSHALDTLGCSLAVYSPAGVLLLPTLWTWTETNASAGLLTMDATLLPLVGVYRVTVVGV